VATPDSHATLSEEIAHRLINSIVSGRFRFGERLPPERELARYMNVGRPTLREALRVLSMLGLVDVRHGDGTFVVENHADFIARAFSWTILLDRRSVDELIDARAAVESMLAELAAQRADPGEVLQLRRLVHTMQEAAHDAKSFSKADLEFHLVIARSARNLTLSRSLFALQSLLKEWVSRALPAAPDSYQLVCEQHRGILDAIEDRDGAAANSAMRTHLGYVGNLLRLSIQRTPGDPASEVLGAALNHEHDAIGFDGRSDNLSDPGSKSG
jgi:GntR family transcriptional repressor for pyruvate dehydrogenase complex